MNLDKLDVRARAEEFALSVHREVIPCLPNTAKWSLADQLRRAAQSIPANIAEGHGRYHFLDNVRFCYIARGSLTEAQSHMALAHRLGYLPTVVYDRMTASAESLGRRLNAYISYLKRTKPGADLQSSPPTLRDAPEFYFADDDPTNSWSATRILP